MLKPGKRKPEMIIASDPIPGRIVLKAYLAGYLVVQQKRNDWLLSFTFFAFYKIIPCNSQPYFTKAYGTS